MAKDKDYKEVLSGTVEEVKGKVRNMDSPDYRELLKLEKKGDDRQTLKDFLNRKIDALKSGDEEDESEEAEETEDEAETEDTDDSEESEDAEETVEHENEGFMDKLSALSAGKILLIGGAAGLIVGLLMGYGLGPGAGVQGQPDEARSAVEDLVGAGNFNGTADVGQPESRNGMYFFNVTMTQETPNGTQTGNQALYITKDAELLFPVVQSMFLQSPINVEDAMAQQRQAEQQQGQPSQPQAQ